MAKKKGKKPVNKVEKQPEPKKKNTGYQIETVIAFVLAIMGMMVANITGEILFSRLGWVAAGLLFVIWPQYPDSPYWENLPKEKAQLYMRVVGLFIIIFGLVVRFGN